MPNRIRHLNIFGCVTLPANSANSPGDLDRPSFCDYGSLPATGNLGCSTNSPGDLDRPSPGDLGLLSPGDLSSLPATSAFSRLTLFRRSPGRVSAFMDKYQLGCGCYNRCHVTVYLPILANCICKSHSYIVTN